MPKVISEVRNDLKNTYPSEVSVCGVVCVKIVETFGDIQ